MLRKKGSRRWRTTRSSPQSTGAGIPLGGGLWRAVTAKSAPEKTGRIPIGHGQPTARDEDASELGSDEFGAGSEHGAEHADHGVEARIGIGQCFRITLVELDLETFGAGTVMSLREEIGGDVDTGNDAP